MPSCTEAEGQGWLCSEFVIIYNMKTTWKEYLGNGFIQEGAKPNGRSDLISRLKDLSDQEFEARDVPGIVKPRVAKGNNVKYENAYRFYEDIVPEIRKREMGVSRLSDRDSWALGNLRDVPVRTQPMSLSTRLFGGLGGYADTRENPWTHRRSIVDLLGGKHEILMPHELKHIAASKGLWSTRDSMERLQREYGYLNNDRMDMFYKGRMDRDDALAEEMRATNTEIQFRVYRDLMKKLGRNPTAKEYLRYIDDMPDKDVLKLRDKPSNGYDIGARGFWRSLFNIRPPGSKGKERADQIRRLLNSVTMKRPSPDTVAYRHA